MRGFILVLIYLVAGGNFALAQNSGEPADIEDQRQIEASSSPQQVDVMIVLATDVSGSIDFKSEYLEQKQGMVTALRDPELAYTLESCNGSGLGITYLEWSGELRETRVDQRVGWRRIRTGAGLRAFADEIAAVEPSNYDGQTDLISALRVSAALMQRAPFTSARQIISLSSDGVQNIPPPEQAFNDHVPSAALIDPVVRERDQLLAQKIVIDALLILNDPAVPNLVNYYRANVIGGLGSQIVPVHDFQDYARGFKKKLLRELDNCST